MYEGGTMCCTNTSIQDVISLNARHEYMQWSIFSLPLTLTWKVHLVHPTMSLVGGREYQQSFYIVEALYASYHKKTNFDSAL